MARLLEALHSLGSSVGVLSLGALCLSAVNVTAQGGSGPQAQASSAPSTLGLEQGTLDLETPDFRLRLVRASQTVAALEPKVAAGFDFTPADQLQARAGDRFFHLGDLTLRLRQGGAGEWKSYSTAAARRPLTALPTAGAVLAAADLAATLPADVPLKVVRSWTVRNGRLVLTFTLTNKSHSPVEIGALGIPLVFNNYITERSLEQAHAVCAFSDPYIGLDAGYLQVTRLNGHGPALVVVGEGHTPFEAYHPLLDDPTRRTQTFEGFYEWMTHSQAYAENEWKGAEPWNRPSAVTLAPGETREYGLRFLVASEIRKIEATLAADRRAVAVGVPGYVLPMDLDGRLFLKSIQPVTALAVEPQGAIEIAAGPTTPGGWASYTLRGKTWGRARLTLTYADGRRQAIHYRVIKPAVEAVADLGRFLLNRQWFVDAQDPFGRSPSVMSYDRELNAIVRQDPRVWIAGLGDEGGSGSWLAAAMKLFLQPERGEIEKYQQFIDQVLWGRLQYSTGPLAYGVRKSLFYYEPSERPAGYYDSSFDWSTWTSWTRAKTEVVDRSFNYPHVVATYWALYRLARNHPGLVTNHAWDWYLAQAYETTLAMVKLAPYYARFGQMEGTVFVELLRDLGREGWSGQAASLEATMKARVDEWRKEAFPFGSEMAWDSTGQEEVYAWTKHFGHDDQAQVTLDAILGYMPTVPHWGYNGNARRYWDFLYGGKLRRIERQLHHYGSSLNALPVMAAYREHPEDLFLLRVGYGGLLGSLTNIDQEGFASAAFHAWPQTLAFDAYSGDYGPSFLGHALGAATYVVRSPELGWLAFGGNLKVAGEVVGVTPLDASRSRLYVAPLGLWITLDAGGIESIQIAASEGVVRVGLAASMPTTPQALLRVEQPARSGLDAFTPVEDLVRVRDGYQVPLGATTTWITLRNRPAPRPAGAPTIGRIKPPDRGFFTKQLDYHGLPIKAPDCVSDEALFEAWRRLDRQLRSNPMIVANLARAGSELHIIGKDQVTSDLPEWRWARGRLYDGKNDIDKRTRGMGGTVSSCGEENLLGLPTDRYFERDICNHEFAHAIHGSGLSPNVRQAIDAQYAKAMKQGLWKQAYASTDSGEYFAELTMWYFGNRGDMNIAGVTDVQPGAAWLKRYDPEGFALLDRIYQGRADVREVLQPQRDEEGPPQEETR